MATAIRSASSTIRQIINAFDVCLSELATAVEVEPPKSRVQHVFYIFVQAIVHSKCVG